jgi:predicted unusual protein kinase regulating ubiquinone biosynthesis (AarF/ABC1/UbiB family)
MSHEDDGSPPLRDLARGFRKRTLRTVRLAAGLGARMARRNLGMRAIAEEVDEDAAAEAAQALLEQLDGMKGLAMKLGQMASYLDASMPPKARRVLARLQSRTTPMEPAAIAAVFTAELGAPPDEVFDAFEPTPFAAASIGQVHRARRGRDALAVKVQYPGIRDLLSADVATIGRLTRLATLLSPVDGGALVHELGDRVLAECDYEQEARNQEQFRALLAGRADATVPRAHLELSTARVLTSDLSSAQPFEAFCDDAGQQARDRAGAAIYDVCFQTVFGRCLYNADPHPGNYLFDPDGRVTFLDFGCVKHFSPDFIDRWKRLARSILDDDFADFCDAFVEVGLVGRKRRFDFEHQWQAMRVLYRPMLSAEPFVFSPGFIEEVNDALLFRNANKLRFAMPPDWLFLNRLQFGLFSVLSHLGARIPCADLFRAAVDSPTHPVSEPAAA